MRETDANDDALSRIPLDPADVGLMISTFATAARLGAVNPDFAVDLREVITGIGIALLNHDQTHRARTPDPQRHPTGQCYRRPPRR
ncbi:hypothetical protein [Amycolatopsis sp.]|uniref:hypothetical protein n=1 Tax=Amycolatopsis sp. TaxID=37632 RepID=UPI002B7D470A|nr:hypothetical protein [Amycolatopsis sp.]HVV12383.1 hypothetical protein [Amycolatopsis sp.]